MQEQVNVNEESRAYQNGSMRIDEGPTLKAYVEHIRKNMGNGAMLVKDYDRLTKANQYGYEEIQRLKEINADLSNGLNSKIEHNKMLNEHAKETIRRNEEAMSVVKKKNRTIKILNAKLNMYKKMVKIISREL